MHDTLPVKSTVFFDKKKKKSRRYKLVNIKHSGNELTTTPMMHFIKDFCHLNQFTFNFGAKFGGIQQLVPHFLNNCNKNLVCSDSCLWLDLSPWQQRLRLMGIIVFRAVFHIKLQIKHDFSEKNVKITDTDVNQCECYIMDVLCFCVQQHWEACWKKKFKWEYRIEKNVPLLILQLCLNNVLKK